MNRATLTGFVVDVPQFVEGKDIVRFTLETTLVRGKVGEEKEKAVWHHVVVLNRDLIRECRHLTKGSYVTVEGTIEGRSFQDHAGTRKFITEIIVGIKVGAVLLLDEKVAAMEPA